MAGGSADRHADGPGKTAPLAAAAALVLAAANVTFGLLYRTDPENSADLMLLLDWSREWLHGGNPYAGPYSLADYPPHALVLLSPLSLLPAAQVTAIWSALHVLLSIATAALASRLAGMSRWSLVTAAAVIALPPFRIVTQTSLAPFALGAAGFISADRYPRLAGVAIGLSLAKPQIGGPFLLWAIVAKRGQTVIAAGATVAALFALYVLRVLRPPHWILSEWWQALARTQNRDDLTAGQTHLQPLLSWLPLTDVWIQIVTAGLLGAALVAIARRRRTEPRFDLRFAAAACLVSLLSFRHLSYNLLLAVPALVFCVAERRAGRWVGLVAWAVLVASPPSLWLHLIEPRFGPAPLDALAAHAYRLAGAALFLYLVFATDRARTPSGRPPASA